MNQARALGSLAAIILLATSCALAKGPTAGSATDSPAPATPRSVATSKPTPPTASGTRLQCPAVQPAPRFAGSTASNRELALVWLRGSERLVVRDITDINHPSTVRTLQDLGAPQFVSATDISYVTGESIVRIPLAGSPSKVVAPLCLGQVGFGWSPDGKTLAYVTDTKDGNHSELDLVAAGQNRVAAIMPRWFYGVGCAGQVCEDNADARLLFSPDGRFISLVQGWGGPELRIWTSSGKTLKSIDADAPTGTPTMSVWSGKGLYFRDARGVIRWRDGTQSGALPAVKWVRPKGSPAGGQIVYMAREAGVPSVFVLDTASGAIRILKTFRSEPAFLTSRYIWYQGERRCATGDSYPCGSGGTSIPTGKTYIYDLETGVETESIITKVWDVWPHAG